MLHLSMSEVFGQLKTVAAIPFSRCALNIQELVPFDSWNYGARTGRPSGLSGGRRRLIKIGPEAARAVIQSLPESQHARGSLLVAVFVVSQIEAFPRRKSFWGDYPATTGPDALITYWATTGGKVSHPTAIRILPYRTTIHILNPPIAAYFPISPFHSFVIGKDKIRSPRPALVAVNYDKADERFRSPGRGSGSKAF